MHTFVQIYEKAGVEANENAVFSPIMSRYLPISEIWRKSACRDKTSKRFAFVASDTSRVWEYAERHVRMQSQNTVSDISSKAGKASRLRIVERNNCRLGAPLFRLSDQCFTLFEQLFRLVYVYEVGGERVGIFNRYGQLFYAIGHAEFVVYRQYALIV